MTAAIAAPAPDDEPDDFEVFAAKEKPKPQRWVIMLAREGDPVGFYDVKSLVETTGLESKATIFATREAAEFFLLGNRKRTTNRFPGHTTYILDLDNPFSRPEA